MKKRSLLTAVVMLVISAMVLTSSTYAWFAAQHEATAAKVEVTVSGGDLGNVLIKSATTDWKTSLTATELKSSLPTMYPVDIDPAVGVGTIKAADYDTANYTVSTESDQSHILTYTWYVKAQNASNASKIVIPVAFDSGSFLYGLISVDGTLYATSGSTNIWGPSSNSYKALGSVTAATDKSTSGNVAGVIDADEPTDGNSLGNTVTVNPTNTIEITSDLTSQHTIIVYVWAEGQDSDCTGAAASSTGGFTFGTTGTGNGIHLA